MILAAAVTGTISLCTHRAMRKKHNVKESVKKCFEKLLNINFKNCYVRITNMHFFTFLSNCQLIIKQFFYIDNNNYVLSIWTSLSPSNKGVKTV